MYYTDAEVYRSVKRGVTFDVIAQLNGCSVKEVKSAYKRYECKMDAADVAYKEVIRRKNELEKQCCSYSENNNCRKKGDANMGKQSKFKYTPELEQAIRHKLSEGLKPKEIYDSMFSDTDNKPALHAFRLKCNKLKATTNDAKADGDAKSTTSLDSLQQEIQDTIDTITEEYKKAIHSLVELQIKVENELNR